MPYLTTVPSLLRKIYGDVVWDMPASDKSVYLSFDDGPHPTETLFVLEQLAKYGAKATFFCIGKNVEEHPPIYQHIISEGHAVGNHSFHHLNGWKTASQEYYNDIEKAGTLIHSPLFRPPYGRITARQVRELKKRGLQTIMWSVISGDFDRKISPQKCVSNIMKQARPGAIIVFHDSTKASANLRGALPLVLEKLSGEGYSFKSLL